MRKPFSAWAVQADTRVGYVGAAEARKEKGTKGWHY